MSPAYKAVQSLTYSPDGRTLAVTAKDGAVRLWSTREARLLGTLTGQAEGQTRWVNDARFLADGRRLLTVGSDLTVRHWDADLREPLAALHGHIAAINALALSPDGGRAYTGDADGRLLVWDLAALAQGRESWVSDQSLYEVAFRADGRRAATAHWRGEIRLWDTDSARVIAAWKGHEESGVRVRWSPDGRWLATTGNDGRVALWDAASRTLAKELAATGGGQITTVAFHPAGARVLTVPYEAGAWDVTWSPDGERLAVIVLDKRMRLLEAPVAAARPARARP